jgi:hypothetical protein
MNKKPRLLVHLTELQSPSTAIYLGATGKPTYPAKEKGKLQLVFQMDQVSA